MPDESPPTPSLPIDVTQFDDSELTSAEVSELEGAGIIGEDLGAAVGQNVVNGTSDEVKRLRQILRAILAILHMITPP